MNIHFRPKNGNESHLIILVFFFLFIHSVTKSALQCAANTVPISSSFAFLQVVVVDGIPLSSCTVYNVYIFMYICGIFLDDISTRGKFAFLVYCYRVKAVFHNLCTVLYWCLCGLTNSPIVKYHLNWGWCAWSAQKVLSTMASECQTAFVVSHKMSWCALLTAVKNYNKSLEKLQAFFFKTETKTKT